MGGESRRKREKKPLYKPTDKLSPLQIAKDKIINEKQRNYCRNIIDKILDDETSLSFSKPVDELWDRSVLSDYFEKIKNPMDLGTVQKRISIATNSKISYNNNSDDNLLFDPNKFREEARLVFTNAIYYNGRNSDLGKLSGRFLQIIDSDLEKLPIDPNAVNPSSSTNLMDGEPGDSSINKEENIKIENDNSNDIDDDDDDIDDDEDEDELENDNKSSKQDTVKNELLDGGDVDMEDKNDVNNSIDEERNRLETEINRLSKAKSRAHANLAEFELEKNVPLSYEENSKLRDDVEALPWDISQKVVKILRKYVDDALRNCNERDPEFVTLEFSTVEPKLLREIEDLIKPDPRVEKEKATISNAERELDVVKRKLKRLNDGSGASGKKKRSKKSR